MVQGMEKFRTEPPPPQLVHPNGGRHERHAAGPRVVVSHNRPIDLFGQEQHERDDPCGFGQSLLRSHPQDEGPTAIASRRP